MTQERVPAGSAPWSARATAPLAERLERGEIIVYERCPFDLPEGDDRCFLLEQRLRSWGHKNISFDPQTGRVAGFRRRTADQPGRLRRIFHDFSGRATAWLANTLPAYARAWQPDRASLRSEEEATRRLRLTARNDLLHVDAFPTRPSYGRRILRLFVNIHPNEPRVWVTSMPFAHLLTRYGEQVRRRRPKDERQRRRGDIHPFSLFHWAFSLGRRSDYDRFMVRFHDFLKTNDDFQERCPKRFWSFPPGSAWLAFTDGIAHAVVRGQYALEHSYFVAPEVLSLPAQSPAALLARSGGTPALKEAA